MDWPFSGRGAELDLVTELLREDPPQTGVVLVGGPGVGKTRLAREAAEVATRRGWTVRTVEGTAAGRSVPLGAFTSWLDRLDDQPLTLVSAVVDAIVGTVELPVLVTVDDAHLLDDLSAFVLHKLVTRRAAVRVIATLRRGVPAPETVTALWKDGHLRRLDLQPLSQTDCDALIRAALGGPVAPAATERIWELTRGNVLFLHQLVRQEVDAGRLARDDGGRWQWTNVQNGPITVSATLADLVQADIGAAPAEVLDVVDLTALSEPLDLIHLTALADTAAIEDAERRGLIRICHDEPVPRVRIGHPLYAEARRSTMGQMRAMRLRGRIAGVIAAQVPGSSTSDPVRLGLLWLESDLAPNAELMHQAAAEAFRRLDVPLSLRLAEAAVRAGGDLAVRVLHARTLALLGRPAEADETLGDLAAGQAPDALWAAAVGLRAINVLLAHGRPDESWAVIDNALSRALSRALSCAVSRAPQPVVHQLQAVRALQLAMAARPAEVVALADSINRNRLEVKTRINLNFGLTIALGDLGHPRAATQAPEDATVLAGDPPVDTYEAVTLAVIHADALVTNGCIGDARALGERIGRQWSDLPKVPHLLRTALDGVVTLSYGDLPTACSVLGAVLSRIDPPVNPALPYLGVVYWLSIAHTEALARAGRTDAAIEAMAAMARHRHPAYRFIEPNRLLAQSWVAAARGRSTESLTLVAEAADFARRHGQNAREVLCLQTAIQFGDTPSGARLSELAELVDGPRAQIAARWAAATSANNGRALLEVSGELEAMGDRIAAADAAAQAARIFELANLRGARLTAGTRAAQLAADCGASTPATSQAATPLPLTAREREIAAMVREGMSNKDIADTLTTSVRTVEGHVYRACSKLGLANRAELAALIR